MVKYHVNDNGEVGICKANKRVCKFSADLHTEDFQEAKGFSEMMARESNSGFVKRRKPVVRARREFNSIKDNQIPKISKIIRASYKDFNKHQSDVRAKNIAFNFNSDRVRFPDSVSNEEILEKSVLGSLPGGGVARSLVNDINESLLRTGEKLELSNGVYVRKGGIGISRFVRDFNSVKGSGSYYEGSLEDLQRLVKDNFDNHEPGTGSVDGDVILVNVPPKGFKSPVVVIDDSNRDKVVSVTKARRPGEKEVTTQVIYADSKPDADYVKVVVYRADALAMDNDRTTDDEYEIVAILAQDSPNVLPMHPNEMKRNANNDKGGTYRQYSQKEWDDAYEYWDNYAFIKVE